MEGEEFKKFGGAMLEYITNYLDNIRNRTVLSTVQPGYLRELIPAEAPENSEHWSEIMRDIERVIMPGITHWHSPHFHAYYPTANSYPAIVADMLSGAIACIGFTWIASPACTELEVVMMDWLGQILHLPSKFLASGSQGKGGGVIQGTASEATLVALLSARSRMLKKYKTDEEFDESAILGKLVAYASDQSHSSVERAGLFGCVKMRLIKTGKDLRLRGEALKMAIEADKAKGLIPFFHDRQFVKAGEFMDPILMLVSPNCNKSITLEPLSVVVATLGSTNSCVFDALNEMGEVCNNEGIWLHVDAAYAGSAFVCEEYRYLMNGVENADSFNFNPHKWLLVNFDCSAMWVVNANEVVDAFNVDPFYLKHDMQGRAPDYRHWQIPLGRRFRSLKLWFVMRIYGVKKLQQHIRSQIALAHEFESLLLKDDRFKIVTPVVMGLVCFRLKNKSDDKNEQLLKSINERAKIHIVPSKLHGTYILRFAVCSRYTRSEDVTYAWEEIQEAATLLLKN